MAECIKKSRHELPAHEYAPVVASFPGYAKNGHFAVFLHGLGMRLALGLHTGLPCCTDTHLPGVEAPASKTATAKHVNTYVHLPTSPGRHGRTELQCTVTPVVVEKDTITETKK